MLLIVENEVNNMLSGRNPPLYSNYLGLTIVKSERLKTRINPHISSTCVTKDT